MNLISARARVGTAGVTGNTTFDIYNVTDWCINAFICNHNSNNRNKSEQEQ